MRLLAVSPHLDDAAFSAGGTLALRAREGWDVIVATVFTGNVARPEGFALACQLDKGLGPDIDYMALRREEDRNACMALGARPLHLQLLEAPHRGYETAAALFAGRVPEDRLGEALPAFLGGVIAALDPDLVMGPLTLGDHVDHRHVRDALEIAAGDRRLLLWEDWPYADKPEVTRPAEPALAVPLDGWARGRRMTASAAFASQLGYQFGGVEALAALVASIREERFHRP